MFKWKFITIGCVLLAMTAFGEDRQVVPVLYPKDNAIVGGRVNVVLDPAGAPSFQVTVNSTAYPAVDTAQGAHAFQGVVLEPGLNVISVNVLSTGKDKKPASIINSRSIRVYNADGSFGQPQPGFSRDPFHTQKQEAIYSDCHRLEVSKEDLSPRKPEDVLCYTCHRLIPVGAHIHGPAALWNCLACHNPASFPAKYGFSSADPWKVSKNVQAVEPMLFTFSGASLFNPDSASLISKAGAKGVFAEVLAYLRQNPSDKVRLEVHTDTAPRAVQKKKSSKSKGGDDNQSLSSARARALAVVLRDAGLNERNLEAVGMGDTLPKSPDRSVQGRNLNDRVEVIVHPADVTVENSQKLPTLKDRQRIVVTVAYSKGPQIKRLRVVEQIPNEMHYVKGTGLLKGKPLEPRTTGSELVWELGDRDANFTESLSYMLKKGKGGTQPDPVTRIDYRSSDRDQSRLFDPSFPAQGASTIAVTCEKCHPDVLARNFKHGPVDSGYCTLCHSPHASANSAWLRKPVWDLCTTCHPDQGSGVHVVVGYITGFSHPTKGKRDRSRPGKMITCVSCHDPHGGDHPYFFAYGLKNRFDLCKSCHKK